MRFEWDEEKASRNLRQHGVSFADARMVFDDESAIARYDVAHSELEDRFLILGMSRMTNRVLLVSYCCRAGDMIRIISARKASSFERREYV